MLVLAGACVLALVVVWALADHVQAVRSFEVHLLGDCTSLRGPRVEDALNALQALVSPGVYALWIVVIVVFELVRGRRREAIALGAVMVLAPVSAELLKPVVGLDHEQIGRLGVEPGSWPSGHAAGALALVLCVVLIVPARVRPVVAVLGGLGVLAIGCSLLILEQHMLSDVVGGYLIAVLWMALALAALRTAERRRPGAPLRWPGPPRWRS